MSSIVTDEEVRVVITPFGNFDPAYITLVNDGMIQYRYIKPFLNGFYDTFVADTSLYPDIEADLKKAVSYFTGDEVIEQNGQSKTANLGEMTNFTPNSKTVDQDKMRAKQAMWIGRAIELLEKVFDTITADPDSYPGFEEKDVYFTINLERFTGIV